ncbi:alpha/beta hydrolase [Sphingomonas sp. Leaf257]|jgi:acetyl esterase|uniref:alpha/beta hydrolase n=1 Tax=Sphingomonas sp. Leaf257 TaxID=1736309 RepID=UPI0006FE5C2C|nr:alpha/beta hydrolase [Sphingomonas sp. Leaf257]KQO50465.1 lipase [Sphingomonas sp. Leaf257]
MTRDRRATAPLPELRAPKLRTDVARFLGYYNRLPGPPQQELGPEAARQMMRAARDLTDPPVGPLALDEAFTILGPAGPIPVRRFDPRERREPGPVMLFFHGGGFVIGDIDTHAPLAAEMARTLDLPVLSVGYRLAPEHPWPAAPDDCEAAARWLAGQPGTTGLIVAGDSAGGTLATVTAMSLRDRPADAPVIAQGLLYPATDMARAHPSLRDFAEGYFLTRAMLDWFVACYAADLGDVRAAPMRGELADMPPAVIMTAECDPIRDQGRAYAAALAKAGVPVTFREARGTIHGFATLRKAIPSGVRDLTAFLLALKAVIVEAEGIRPMGQ